MKKFYLLGLLLLSTTTSFAGGYRISTQGQRALAMGHTGVAIVNSAEIAFFNPAGIVYLENKLNISAGVTGIKSNVNWQNVKTGEYNGTQSAIGTPFYLYATYAATEWLSLGLAAYTPYGSAVEYPTDWSGSHLINNIDLKAFYFQGLISLKLSDYFSIGGGPIYAMGGVKFNKNIDRTLTDENGHRSNVEIEAKNISNWGWSAGFMFNPTDKLKIGFNYRSKIVLNAENGEAVFSNVPKSPLVPIQNGKAYFKASMPLPAEITTGFSYQITDKFLVAFDYNHALWSAYKSLSIDFKSNKIPDAVSPRNYKDASTYRIGLQYNTTEKLTLRLGYYYDETPVQSGYFAPETPRNDSQGYTGGLSYQITPKISIDASFAYIHFTEVDESYDHYKEGGKVVKFEGTYISNAFLPGLGVSISL